MAKGLICDGCGTTVKFDAHRGQESETAEESAWITLSADNVRAFHACTRVCAEAILDGEFGELAEAAFAQIAEVARIIREERENDDDDL